MFSPIHILLVSPRPPPQGGIAGWTEHILEEASRHKEVRVDNLNTAPRWRDVDDFRIWKRVFGGGIQLVRDCIRILCALTTRPDVIHLTSSGHMAFFRDICVLFIARQRKIPTVYHLHFGRVPQILEANNWERRVLGKTLSMANTVISLDTTTTKSIKSHYPHVRVLHLPNGLDLNKIPMAVDAPRRRTILFLGWVVPTKGIEELLSAWMKIVHDGWCCVAAGAGSDDYKRELLKRYTPDDFEFMSEQTHADALRLMVNSDIFVLPSHSEGFPYVIVEAMASGRAIVATDVGAISEMLADGCGKIVPAKNEQALASALMLLMADHELRETMGVLAKTKASREYEINNVFDQLMEVWRSCVGSC